MSCSEPSSRLTRAPKSMRSTDTESRLSLTYSWGRISTSKMSSFSKADKMVRAMRLSSIRYLNTTS